MRKLSLKNVVVAFTSLCALVAATLAQAEPQAESVRRPLKVLEAKVIGESQRQAFSKKSGRALTDLVAHTHFKATDLNCGDENCVVKANVVESANLCWKRDVNQVCSTLSALSKNAKEKYDSGDHSVTTLSSCRVLGHGADAVYARFQLRSDYDDAEITFTKRIEKCAG